MANLIKDQTPHRSVLIPLQIRETNASNRTPKNASVTTKTNTPSKNGDTSGLDSTCITPISNASTASQHSSPSITPIKSSPSFTKTAYLTACSSLSLDTYSESTSADAYSIPTDSDDLNVTVTNQSGNTFYESCVLTPKRLKKFTQTVPQRIRRRILDTYPRLQRLSIARVFQINIRGDQTTTTPLNDSEATADEDCSCENGLFDGKCLKSFMEMSVQPAEYRNNSQIMSSTPIITKDVYDPSLFNVARFKKVELHELSPKMSEFHVIEAMPKDRCINNNNLRTPNGNHNGTHNGNQANIFVPNAAAVIPTIATIQAKGQQQQQQSPHQHQSNSTTFAVPEDGSVLKKVISFTLDQMKNAEKSTTRPSFVPEKLHFSAYEQFKGQIFVKWVSSSIAKSFELGEIDLKTVEQLIAEVCTHLIAAGVMKQIIDGDEMSKDVFCQNQMYQWTHIELSRNQLNVNGNGPKTDHEEKVQKQSDPAENNNDDENKTVIFASEEPIQNERDESFATVKNNLLLCDSAMKISNSDTENQIEPNQIDPLNSIQNGEMKHGSDEEAQNCNDVTNGHPKNDESLKQDCDKVEISFVELSTFVEISTQTEETMLADLKEKKSEDTKTCMPPPPPPLPPPPSPLPSICIVPPSDDVTDNKSINEKPVTIATEQIPVTPQQNNSQINIPSTKLSSASSFCPPPPPPMNGMPGPPPLPLPTGNMWFKSDTLRKAAKHPPKPMINLFWTRILIPKEDEDDTKCEPIVDSSTTTKIREKLWQKIDETSLDNADEFTELFSRQPTPKRPREVTKVPKKTVIKVLDHKRSQSVGIFSQSLYRHRINSEMIQHAVYNWDLTNIGLDLLQQMLEHKATDDELKAIKDAQKTAASNVPLDGPEQFLLKFSEISCAPERIACMIFRNDFEEASALIERKIKLIRDLCEFLMNDCNLSDLFSIILTFGNYMNGGNRYRGQADGFGLDVLGKLRDVRSKDKKITLLHFIVKTFISRRRQNGLKPKEISYPVPDADDVKSASTVDFDVLIEQIDQLSRNIKEIKAKMKIVIDASTAENIQPFEKISEEFACMATNKIDSQFSQLRDCKVVFRKTLDYFNHIPKTGTIDECTPSQFFELWLSFSIDFRDLWKKEIAAINAEILQKYKSVASPKTPSNRAKGKQKPNGLRVRRVNQI